MDWSLCRNVSIYSTEQVEKETHVEVTQLRSISIELVVVELGELFCEVVNTHAFLDHRVRERRLQQHTSKGVEVDCGVLLV
jgi:hypothetical protein